MCADLCLVLSLGRKGDPVWEGEQEQELGRELKCCREGAGDFSVVPAPSPLATSPPASGGGSSRGGRVLLCLPSSKAAALKFEKTVGVNAQGAIL